MHRNVICKTFDADEDDISLAHLAQNLRPALPATEAEKFIDVDNLIAICAPATEDDIVREVQEEIAEETEERFIVPTLNDGLNAKTENLKMPDNTSEFPGQGEWEQMIRDIVTNKDTNSQDCGTELKELYFQISKTIDLLNS